MTDAIDKAVREARSRALEIARAFCQHEHEAIHCFHCAELMAARMEERLWPLVDAVLEEAAKAVEQSWQDGDPFPRAPERVRALKSPPADKGKE